MFKIQELTPFIQESWIMGKPQVVREWVNHDTSVSHKTRLCHSRAFTFSEWNTFMCEHVRPGAGKTLIFPGTPCTYDLPKCNTWAFLLPLNIFTTYIHWALLASSWSQQGLVFLIHCALHYENLFTSSSGTFARLNEIFTQTNY